MGCGCSSDKEPLDALRLENAQLEEYPCQHDLTGAQGAALVLSSAVEAEKRLKTAVDYGKMCQFFEDGCGLKLSTHSRHGLLHFHDTIDSINDFFSKPQPQHALALVGGDAGGSGFWMLNSCLCPYHVLKIWSYHADKGQNRHLFIFIDTCFDAKWAEAASHLRNVVVQCSTLPEEVANRKRTKFGRQRCLKTPDAYSCTFTEHWLQLQEKHIDSEFLEKGSFFCPGGDLFTLGTKILKLRGYCIESLSRQVHRPVCKLDATEFLPDGTCVQYSHGQYIDLIANSVGGPDGIKGSLKLVLDWRHQAAVEDGIEADIAEGMLRSQVYKYFNEPGKEQEELHMMRKKTQAGIPNPSVIAALIFILANEIYNALLRPNPDVQKLDRLVSLMLLHYDSHTPSSLVRGALHAALGLWHGQKSQNGSGDREKEVMLSCSQLERAADANLQAQRNPAAVGNLLLKWKEQQKQACPPPWRMQESELNKIMEVDPNKDLLRNRMSQAILKCELYHAHTPGSSKAAEARALLQQLCAEAVQTRSCYDKREVALRVIKGIDGATPVDFDSTD
eukprot:TRINITY_DN94525_c0_g1_i1.p1 TRINITY_DN94525_c0_g1~~TRINITY_DN94525_c0_g1_i1.p1  ORF type:complete len:561 (-),score=88.24 TRINITY_DN94525_c0_g1_i1:165-1847(-)